MNTEPQIEAVTDDDLLLAVTVMQTRLFADGPEKMTGDFGETLRYILLADRRRVAERQAARPLEKIDRDESYGRSYIPVAPGWEVQTKGKGSTFRLCEPSGDRLAVPDSPYLHTTIERMALAIHAHRVAMEEEIERLRAEVAAHRKHDVLRCDALMKAEAEVAKLRAACAAKVELAAELGEARAEVALRKSEVELFRDELKARCDEVAQYRPFWEKHALGPKSAPSCIVCGQVTAPAVAGSDNAVAIQHLELPGVVVCYRCRGAVAEVARLRAACAAKDAALRVLDVESNSTLDSVVIAAALALDGGSNYIDASGAVEATAVVFAPEHGVEVCAAVPDDWAGDTVKIVRVKP